MIKHFKIKILGKERSYSDEIFENFNSVIKKKKTQLAFTSLCFSEQITKIIYDCDEKIPDKILVEMSCIKVFDIHKTISKKFGSIILKTPSIEKKIASLEKKIESDSISIVEKQDIIDKIVKMKNIISLFSEIKWQEYISKVYNILLQLESQNDDIIVEKYLEQARSFLKIDIVNSIPKNVTCPNCDRDSSLAKYEDGILLCICGQEIEDIACQSITRQIKNCIKIRGLDSFMKKISRVTGSSCDKIPFSLYEDLDTLSKSRGYPSGEEYRNMEANDPRRNLITFQLLKEMLTILGYNTYYNLIETIGHNYYGWALIDLIPYIKKLKEIYCRTQIIYEQIKTRSSNLNVDIRLYVHEKAIGLDVDFNMIKGVSSQDSLDYHYDMLKIMHQSIDLPVISFS